MIVTTISRGHINTISLPEKVKGQFWLHENSNGKQERLVSIEAINEEWVIKSTRYVKLLDAHSTPIKSCVISPLKVYALSKSDGEKLFVFVEPITENRQIFTKYLVRGDVDLTIGRASSNDICYSNQVVSSKHATLSCRSGKWHITDSTSANGTFVNGRRVTNAALKMGDTIYIMGMRIVIGKNLIAINNPDEQVSVSGKLHARLCSRL